MNHRHPRLLRALAHLLLGLCLLLGLSVLSGSAGRVAHAASAATLTVSTCDESHLDAALASASSGDTITFSCSGDITLTQTLTISQNLTLDGSGQTVTLDGQNTVQVFFVNSGVSFTLNALTVAHGSTSGAGGGIFNYGTVTINNSTLSNNSTPTGGGILNGGTAEALGNIIANNSGGNCTGSISDSGYNLSSDGSCSLTGTGSMQNTDPKLDSNGLHNNGGPTQTIALQQGSPAIDQIPAASCPMTDQRGITRPDNQETTCDMGAYEYQDDAPLTLTYFASSPLGHRSAGIAATFTDADPAGQVSDYTATVNWGDGTTSTVTVYKNPVGKGFALAASHSYSKAGTYTLTVTVTDQGGSQVSKTAMLTIK